MTLTVFAVKLIEDSLTSTINLLSLSERLTSSSIGGLEDWIFFLFFSISFKSTSHVLSFIDASYTRLGPFDVSITRRAFEDLFSPSICNLQLKLFSLSV